MDKIDLIPKEVIETFKKDLVDSMYKEFAPIIENAMQTSYNDALAMVLHIVNMQWEGNSIDKNEFVSIVRELMLPKASVITSEAFKEKWNSMGFKSGTL